MELARELGGEPGLADPGGARDERHPGPTGLGLGPALAQPTELALAPGEQRGAALELARQLLGRRRRGEGGVLGEDLLLEAAQLGPGLDPDLLGQRLARLAVGLQGLGLAPGAVEGEHALGVEALVERVLGEQRLERADHLGVSPRRELGVDRELDRAQVKLLEAADLGARERLVGDVGERGAAATARARPWPRRRRSPARPRAALARPDARSKPRRPHPAGA